LILFDEYLAERRLVFDAVIVGAAALELLGVVARTTRDVDVMTPSIPNSIIEAAVTFAKRRRSQAELLDDEWLNNGPASLAGLLPGGWEARLVSVFEGKVISLRPLGRSDLLKTKRLGLCDRGTDIDDCFAMKPTLEELVEATSWLEQQDAHPGWPAHVRETLADLGRRLGHDVH